MSPALRWWSPWWWPLVHLCSFRCRLLDGSHYTRLANVRQTKSTQTPPKPLQTLVFVGVSQPHDGDTKTADTTATATPRDVTATSRRPCPGTPRHPGHDGHATARPQPRHGHDGHDGHGHDRIRGTCPRDTTRHAKTQSHRRTNVAPCNKHPRGGASRPAPSAGAGGTIAEIARGFLKSSRTKRDACNLSSRSAYGLQAFQNQVVQPLLHLFC